MNLRSWILGVTGAALLMAAAAALTPKGRVKGVVKLLCGVVMAINLLGPIIALDFEALSANLFQYNSAYEVDPALLEANDSLTALIIEGQCQAYILDKAQVLGLAADSVKVSLKRDSEGTWYPYEADLEISGPENDVRKLRDLVESELGIPSERQRWRNGDEQNHDE